MKIKEQLTQDLKQSMIAGEKERRDTIRYLIAQIKNAEIKKQDELEESEISDLLLKQSQQRTESIEAYSEANRSDLVDKEKIELEIIKEYLPKQLTQEEIFGLVSGIIWFLLCLYVILTPASWELERWSNVVDNPQKTFLIWLIYFYITFTVTWLSIWSKKVQLNYFYKIFDLK